VNRERALMELPMAHATALRLHAAGADHALIATALGIDAEGVAPLLALAQAKLDRALAHGRRDAQTGESGAPS
jgi:DNA-directed RNA polymerase specialized sigma24 family protein